MPVGHSLDFLPGRGEGATVGSAERHGEDLTGTPPVNTGEMRLEVVVLPVSDVDRAKGFYEGLGWRLDADLAVEDGYRVVQLTPPGSACSIIFGEGVTAAPPGSSEAEGDRFIEIWNLASLSAIRMATAGWSKRSRPGFPAGEEQRDGDDI